MQTTAPTLTTDRLTLRGHRMGDLPALRDFYLSARAVHMDRPQNETQLWFSFASEVGSWALRGMGPWAIETREGSLAGQVAVTQPPHFPETELGWLVFDGFEGCGIAFEAAECVLGYTKRNIRPPSLVSYIDRDNARSVALARRLGARLDAKAKASDPADLVYRHAIQETRP